MTFDVRQVSRCHLCGRMIVRGLCPVCDSAPAQGRRSRSLDVAGRQLRIHRPLIGLPLLTVVVLLVLVLHAIGAHRAGVHAALPRAHAAVPPSASTPERSAMLRLNVPMSDWDTAGAPPGVAFAVRSGRGASVLLTDYHVLVARYLDGDHMVTVSLDGRPVQATVLAVSPDPHVATVAVNAALPALPLAARAPGVGDRVTLDAPDGTAASGTVVRYRGPGGSAHLAFTAVVPPDLAGAPVLNARGQVVGVAEPTEQFAGAGAIGFAVPIAIACRAVSC